MKITRRRTINIKRMQDATLLVYFCAWYAHMHESGFDVMFRYSMIFICLIPTLILFIKQRYFPIREYTVWTVAFFLYNLCACFWTSSLKFSFDTIQLILHIIIIGICLSGRIRSVDDAASVLKLMYMAALYAFVLLAIRTPLTDWGTDRIGSALGMWRNALGSVLGYGMIISVYLMLSTQKKRTKLWYLATAAILFVAILFTRSRSTLLFVSVSIFLLIVTHKAINYSAKAMFKLMVMVVAMIAIAAVAIYYMMNNEVLYNAVGKRMLAAVQIVLGGSSSRDGSIVERRFLAKNAWELFFQHPLFGYGPNTFKQYMVDIGFSRIEYSHNNYLELLCTLGIVGTGIYLYMPLRIFLTLLPTRFANGKERVFAAAVWSINVGYLLLSPWNVYSASAIHYFVFAIAMSSKCAYCVHKKPKEKLQFKTGIESGTE